MQMAVVAHAEDIRGATLSHLDNGVFDLDEFLPRLVVVAALVVQGGEDAEGLVFAAGEDEPARGLGHEKEEAEGGDGEDELDGDGDAPGGGRPFDEGEAEVDPVAEGEAGGDAGPGGNHQHGAAAVRLRALGLPGRDCGRVEAVAETRDHAAGDELAEGVGRGLDDLADDEEG